MRWRWMIRGLLPYMLMGWLLAAAIGLDAAQPAPVTAQAGNPAQGQQIFEQKCVACHTIGKGKLVGPDLQGVAQRRDATWLTKFIADPGKVIDSGDPTAQQLLSESNGVRMPALGLSPGEVESVIAFLGNPSGAGISAPAAQAIPGNGNASRGRLLFLGELALQNGGTPCLACHSVSGVGAIGGGALGPDLTHVLQRYSPAGLAAAIQNIAFPTMVGPFTGKALTPGEQADLLAFFQQADQQTTALTNTNAWIFLGLGVAGLAILFAALLAYGPNPRLSAIEKLRRNA